MPKRLVLISPTAVAERRDIQSAGAERGEVQRVWIRAPKLGGYLKEHRERLHLSLRRASESIGISHTYLAMIEQEGTGTDHLSLEHCTAFAEAYDIDHREVLHQAGCRYAVPEDVARGLDDIEKDRFRRLFLHPELRPPNFAATHLRWFAEPARRAVLELVTNVETYVRNGGAELQGLLDGDVDGEAE